MISKRKNKDILDDLQTNAIIMQINIEIMIEDYEKHLQTKILKPGQKEKINKIILALGNMRDGLGKIAETEIDWNIS